MKLLIFISSLNGGGAERVTATLANHWARKGWNVSIVTLEPQSDDFYELHPAIKRIALDLSGASRSVFVALAQNSRRVLALRRTLREIQPDVALGMMTGANVLLAVASLGLTSIHTVGAERIYPPQFPLGAVWEWLRRSSYRRLDAVVAQTDECGTWLRTHTTSERVAVIPNPVDWPLKRSSPSIAVNEVVRTGRSLLLAVGRLVTQKQFGLLIDCFATLASRHPGWDLAILGEGPLRSALGLQVRTAALESRIFLPGRAGNVGDWYERADLYVMSSGFEGFPNTLLEAMSHGLPAVSFDCDAGPRDIIEHGVNGLLVASGDVAGLTAALDQLMGDEALRREFASRASDVRERFALERIARQWETVFEK
jgi:glycosyltransferase involved in cell wall biosynthesis